MKKVKIDMKRLLTFIAICIMLIAACGEVDDKSSERPNIIYILADDMGYGDLSCLGQEILKTPQIDKLASEGMVFTDHYAGSAVCGPSRAVLMTGQHTGHTAIRGNKAIKGIGVAPLDPNVPTLPETIKKNTGYITAMFGRWHLGGELSDQTPYQRGFDYHFGKLSSDYGNKFGVMIDTLWDENGKHVNYEKYSEFGAEPMYENGKLFDLSSTEMAMRPINMDELVTDKAIRFIKKEKKKPYFLYVAYALVHSPMEYHEKYPVQNTEWPEEERAFASMLMALDDYVGKITRAVDESEQKDNTIIIFTSDNGAHNHQHDVEFFNSNGEFREYKRSFLEGGFHTPMIVRWPGVVEPGSTSDHISAFWDVMPTLCDIAGAPIPQHSDGISFLPTLEGVKQTPHDYLYWEFNESIYGKKNQYKQAVRKGDWKGIYYVEDEKFELYNLNSDISEMNDLALQHQEIVEDMRQIMIKEHVPNERFPLLKSERANE
jgi:arylsulfatase A-like enzyme